jgi:Xaa-Pro aminopeptidase
MRTCSSQADWSEIFRERRNRIRAQAGKDLILWLGHSPQPRNYTDNTYVFRQNSHFLYYAGLSEPDLAMLSFPEPDHDILFAKPISMDDIVWTGPKPSHVELAQECGINTVQNMDCLEGYLNQARTEGVRIHYLPPYQFSSIFRLAQLLHLPIEDIHRNVSPLLMEQVALQRSVKSDVEIAEIEEALAVTDRMHRACRHMIRLLPCMERCFTIIRMTAFFPKGSFC